MLVLVQLKIMKIIFNLQLNRKHSVKKFIICLIGRDVKKICTRGYPWIKPATDRK